MVINVKTEFQRTKVHIKTEFQRTKVHITR